ncbi:MAG: hydrogenase maturation protease [bacterium]|nr:hydrogenase maturation protease [bacterium]
MASTQKILILGLGNTLLSDDGVGVHIVNALQHRFADRNDIDCLEGGTLGLSLLPEMNNTSGFIAVDAAQIDRPPGTVVTFENAQMDAQLAGRKRTAHEVALADLMDTALLTGIRPERRALVAIQPESTCWGDAPSKRVANAMEYAECEILSLIERWET